MDSIIKKLLIKKDGGHLVLNAPKGYEDWLNELLGDFEIKVGQELDWLLIFAANQAELKHFYAQISSFIGEHTIFWVAYPKKSSKMKSDISRDKAWDVIYSKGYRTVSLVSLDETWSAMRFAVGEMPDLEKKKPQKLILPLELKEAFKQDNQIAIFFNSLTYTNRKEYLNWINEAKKDETRQKRIEKTIELLMRKQKTK